MFGFFSKKSSNVKGYKITDNDRTRRIGVAAKSLDELKEKSCKKFNIEKCRIFLATDGTEIDDETYFQSIPAQALFVVIDDGAKLSDNIKTDFDIVFEKFKTVNSELLQSKELINQFLSDKDNQEVLVAIEKVQNIADEKIKCSLKSEHADWFQGADQKYLTKEEVMEKRSQDRIKGYFYKTKEELTKSDIYKNNKKAKELLDTMLDDFFLFLNGVNYFSCLFNRKCQNRYSNLHPVHDATDGSIKRDRAVPRKRIRLEVKEKIGQVDLFKKYSVSLCTKYGKFDCHGIWHDKQCTYSHTINPYASRESLIFFQTYNLDHQIEISRSILPSILKNVEKLVSGSGDNCTIHKKKGCNLSVITYFMEIFTVKNLKLVHIVCHDKAIHNLKSKGRILCPDCKEFKFLDKIKKQINKN